MTVDDMWISRILASYFLRQAKRKRSQGSFASAHNDFARSARLGSPEAQYEFALAHLKGEGCVRSGSIAKKWLINSAEAGYIEAQFELGVFLLDSKDKQAMAGASSGWLHRQESTNKELISLLFPEGVESRGDPQQAFHWISSAAQSGKLEAQANLGWLYFTGTGCERSLPEALKWLSAGANGGIAQAALGLAEYYKIANSPDFDIERSFNWAKRASDLGNGSGSFLVGVAYRDGNGVEANHLEAEKYFCKSAVEGHILGGYEAAVIILRRRNSIEDIKRAIEFLRVSAKSNHRPSASLLAQIYSRHDSVIFDEREAAFWYRYAAERGDTLSQFNLACLYSRGEGVSRDLVHAVKYLSLAAANGHVLASFNLAIFKLSGQGTAVSIPEAKVLLKFAADRGLVQAQLRLGQLYLSEASSEVDTRHAISLIEMASANGLPDAKFVLAQFLNRNGGGDSHERAIRLMHEAFELGMLRAGEFLIFNSRPGPIYDKIHSELTKLYTSGSVEAGLILAKASISSSQRGGDITSALNILETCAVACNGEAHFVLGVLYCMGDLVEKDLQLGFQHYLEAAKLGHVIAQYNIGTMLFNGIGTARDESAGVDWLNLAAAAKFSKAVSFLEKLDRQSS